MEITVKVNYKTKTAKAQTGRWPLQSQLAEAAGVNVRMYQKYEQGDRDISKAQLSTLLRICKALSCKLSDIVTDAETSELLAEYEK
ncbi:MAG: helix-turn-helix domain-containing protein [Butyricicoccaceae bacterium]